MSKKGQIIAIGGGGFGRSETTLTCHYLIIKVYEIPSTGALLLIEDTLSDKLNEGILT